MKSDKARKVTSREYIMKLIYQIEMNKEDIENIEERLDIFLNDNLEYNKAILVVLIYLYALQDNSLYYLIKIKLV